MAHARIAITPDGKIAVFVDEGTLADAEPKLKALFELLQAGGLTLDEIDPVEQHRHDDAHAHQHAFNVPHSH